MKANDWISSVPVYQPGKPIAEVARELGFDDVDEIIKVASISFVLANGDRHGFGLCPGIKDIWACKDKLENATNWPLTGDNVDLTGFLRERLLSLKGDLELAKDGRLCDRGQQNCLIDRWQR